MRRIALAAAVILAAVTNLWAQAGQLPAWNVLGNPSAAASNSRSASLNALFNGAFCSTNNNTLVRLAGVWTCATQTQLTALINPATTALSGALPAWPNDATKFFSGAGTYITVPFSSIGSTPTTLAGYGITSPLPVAQGGTAGAAASGTLLDNITGFGSTGVLARTAAGTYAFRTIGSGTGITVSNGDGVAGAPSVALANTIVAGGPAGDATHAPVITWNAQGQLTAVTSAATNVTSVGTAAVGQIPGVSSNTAATAGNIGELITSHVISSTVALTSTVAANVTSISLTAGDWDVWGEVVTAGGATTTVGNVLASISTTSATLNVTDETKYGQHIFFNLTIYNAGSYGTTSATTPVGATQILVNATTTVFLVVQSQFATSTSTAGGTIYARRRR